MVSDETCRLLTACVDAELDCGQRQQVGRLLRESVLARQLLRQLGGDAQLLRDLPWRTPHRDVFQWFTRQITGQVLGSRR